MAWPMVPKRESRAERFDELAFDCARQLERAWGRPFPAFDLGVEAVPPGDPAQGEHDEVPLGRMFAARGRDVARIVIYRRPIETRAESDRELADLVAEVVTEQVAALLGVDPGALDPRFGTD